MNGFTMQNTSQLVKNRVISGALLLIASLLIFAIAETIEKTLLTYELSSMYVSFCAGFILFIPLVSLALHPLLFSEVDQKIKQKSTLLMNVGLVMVVQGLFFLIWITDAIAIYSIYVDSNSFLAKAFNITSNSKGDFSKEFYWINLLLAWLFAYLSLVVGLLPCLIARVKNFGVVGNFVSAFQFAKVNKLALAIYSFCLAFAAVVPLMYANYLFIVSFSLTLLIIFMKISNRYISMSR